MVVESPIKEEDLDALNDRLKELDTADTIIDQSIRAGIDMQDQKDRSQELRQRLMKMKQAFFPGR